MRSSYTVVSAGLVPFGIWCFLIGGYQILAALVTGKLTFRPDQSYLWTLWLPVVGMLTLETGVVTIASLYLFCRKLPRLFGVVCATGFGLVIPPVVGLSTGLIEESFGHSLLFRWNAIEGWIWGLVLAVPNAVAAAIALIQIRRVKATSGTEGRKYYPSGLLPEVDREKTSLQLGAETRSSHAAVSAGLVPFATWCLVMGCYLFALYAIAGKPPFGLEQKYVWMQALLTGTVTIAAVGPICSKLPRYFDVTCAAVLGLLLAPAVGLCGGWIEEHYYSQSFGRNMLEWWSDGLVLAVPNAVAAAIAVVQMRHVKATRVSKV